MDRVIGHLCKRSFCVFCAAFACSAQLSCGLRSGLGRGWGSATDGVSTRLLRFPTVGRPRLGQAQARDCAA